MRKSGQRRSVHGILLLDKPAGLTSNKILQRVRWLFNAAKAGHTGNLDPFATGLLPICFGEATKISAFLLDADKTYTARARLGEQTVTGDRDGDVIRTCDVPVLSDTQIRAAMEQQCGPQSQIPPMYSALKVDGTPLYKLARAGQEVERKPRQITIHAMQFRAWHAPDLEFDVHCSKGTYIRTLSEDFASALGTTAHLRALRRTAAGPFTADRLVSIDELEALEGNLPALDEFLMPLDTGLPDMGRVDLAESDLQAYINGREITASVATQPGLVRVYYQDAILAIGELTEDGRLRPKRLFAGLVPKNQAG